MEIEVDPAHKLAKLAKLLKEEAPKQMNRQLTKAMGQVVTPVQRAILGSTDEFLPRRLAKRVARTRLGHRVNKGRNPSVRVTAQPSHQTLRDPYRVDRGRIAHPTFGMPHSVSPWQLQDVKPGWFTEPAEDSAPIVQREILEVIDDFTEHIVKRLP